MFNDIGKLNFIHIANCDTKKVYKIAEQELHRINLNAYMNPPPNFHINNKALKIETLLYQYFLPATPSHSTPATLPNPTPSLSNVLFTMVVQPLRHPLPPP